MNIDIARIWYRLDRAEQHLRRDGDLFGRNRYNSVGRALSNRFDAIGHNWQAQLSRVERLKRAVENSGSLAEDLIASELAGISLSSVWPLLISAAEDIAIYYGGSILLGGAIGGVAGAFAGGIGAVPGAMIGVSAGSTMGGWILALLGLKSLAESLLDAIPAALKQYERGFRLAWGPENDAIQRSSVVFVGNDQAAAMDIARGHVILICALLMSLVAYLTRSKGNSAALYAEIRRSERLGDRFATWLEQNQAALEKHPRLMAQSRNDALASAEKNTTNSTRSAERTAEREGVAKTPAMKQKDVPCFKPNDLPQGSLPEFDRQLQGQEKGLNDMTVQEYLDGRKAFDNKDIVRDPSVAKAARAEYERKLAKDVSKELQDTGVLPNEAKKQAAAMAAEKMKTLAALHNPDMVAAGKDVIGDFGDRNINSRIGSQWRSRVGELDTAAKEVPVSQRANVKMNAKLSRCK